MSETAADRPLMTPEGLRQALERIKATYEAERMRARENLERAQQLHAEQMQRAYDDALSASIALYGTWMRDD